MTTVVGKNFYEVVLNNTNDVFLELIAHWCSFCIKVFYYIIKIAPRITRLAEKLANNPNIVIAKMDANSNEFEGLDVQGFPTFLLFKGSSTGQEKFNSKIRYYDLKKVNLIIDFLLNNTHNPIKDIKTLPNEIEIEKKEEIEDDAQDETTGVEEQPNFKKSPDIEADQEDSMFDWDKHESINSENNFVEESNIDELSSMFAGLGDSIPEGDYSDSTVNSINSNLKENKMTNNQINDQIDTLAIKDDL